jgi:phage tail-like protein
MKRPAIERLLPEVMQRTVAPGSPLGAVLDAMEALHAPSEATLAAIEWAFSPYRAPDGFVPFLAGWVDLDRFLRPAATLGAQAGPDAVRAFSGGLGRLRELVAVAAHLSRWRGTAHGLTLFLSTATGLGGFRVEEAVPDPDDRPRPFHIRVSAPAAALPHRALIEQIVEQEKPAYVTAEIEFAPSP